MESVTLSVYKDQTGGDALWHEIQNVVVDADGHYSVLMGATQNEGMPMELFASGEPLGEPFLPVFQVPGGNSRAQTPIVEIHVEGNSRLPPAAVIAASGLKVGAGITQHDLDVATGKLFETGFFNTVNYRYQPKSGGGGTGYAVTLQVSEAKVARPVELDISGVDETQFWPVLHNAYPLIDRTMPDNDQAVAYYQGAIEATLDPVHREPITMKIEADLKTGKMVAIFRPVRLPSVSDLHFEGSQQIPGSVLKDAVSGLVVGKDYSERDLRRILELNIRPMYEERALLTVRFSSVTAAKIFDGSVSVAVTVEEGPLWTLGKVEVIGEDLPVDEMRKAATFPEGKSANWKQITTQIAVMEKILQRDGYLHVSSNPERVYRKDVGVVDVAVRVKKGKQFRFGALELKGLSAAAEQESRALWKLREGEPMNGPYVDDYLRLILKGPAKGIRSVEPAFRPRPGSNGIDVAISFK